MQRDPMRIAEPCSQSWDEMEGDAERRFCRHCDKHVHDLSALTERSAQRFMKAHRGQYRIVVMAEVKKARPVRRAACSLAVSGSRPFCRSSR